MDTGWPTIRRTWPAKAGLLAAFWLALPCAQAQIAAPEYIADHPELLVQVTQAWGELGYNVAAHQPNRAGESLRIGATSYPKGLGHHASGRLVLLLDGEFATFEAEVGLHPCGSSGSVIFRVHVDGEARFDSGVIRTADPAKPVRVPVENAQELVLESDDAGDGIVCDMANWANARLVRTQPPRFRAPAEAVDVAPFARVTASDPNRMDGARASRVEEYRAEDVFLETDLAPNPAGHWAVPVSTNGIGCLGLNWSNNRAVRELRLRFATPPPAPAAVGVQGWFGESAWQGQWLPLATTNTLEGDLLIIRLQPQAPKGGLFQTRKVRCLFPAQAQPLIVRSFAAFTRTRWDEVSLVLEAEKPARNARGELRVVNGELLSMEVRPQDSRAPGRSLFPTSETGWNAWDLSQPIRVRLKHARSKLFKADATTLDLRLPAGALAIAVKDLLANGCVYMPSHGLFAALADKPAGGIPSLTQHKEQIEGRKTILEEVRAMPDQSLAQAMAKTHHDAQREGPVLLSLAADNTKFVLDRDGHLRFQTGARTKSDWFAAAAELEPVFGDGQRDRYERRLDGGWLPVPVVTIERHGMVYEQRTFVAPEGDPGATPAWVPRPSVCVMELTARNARAEATAATLALRFRIPGETGPATNWSHPTPAQSVVRLGNVTALVATEATAPLAARLDNGTLTLDGSLPAASSARCVVFIGDNPGESWRGAQADRLRAATETYWRALLAPAMQVETPEELLNNVIRASQVRCLIDARSEADGSRVAPWIAAMSYGPLESEAHSVIRGMDFMGHSEFARRGLDFFVHRYNTNGFLTTGYTTFGTAWHLWTLGEHVQLTGDLDWVRKIAPEIKRVGDWILRQREKTRRLDATGQPVPESGLMPPGVMADWSAFAFHFALNAYYYAALCELGTILAAIGDPQAETFQLGAAELQQDLLRGYRWTQAQSPALPLRNGTWIPHYPSQLYSPGPLADFFPGDDAGRSWAYDVELGAHQLVPTGVFAPDSPEVTRMLNHMEDVQFLGEGWFDYPAAQNRLDWFNLGGFAKVQPYYARNAEIYALRDEVRPFIRSYFNSLASLLNPEVLTLWEHFRHSGAWDKTHETGHFLHQTRTLFLQERGDDLWLAPFLPSSWLASGSAVRIAQAPTRFGPAGFTLRGITPDDTLEARIDPPTRRPPRAIVLRLRHPEGKRIKRVELNGRRHKDFESKEQLVRLPAGPSPLDVRAFF